APGFSGDLCNLPVLGLDIGLGEQVSVDLAEFRARHFTVRGARPVLVENIEEKEFFNAAYRGTSGHPQSPECFGNILQIVIRRNPPREAAPETPVYVAIRCRASFAALPDPPAAEMHPPAKRLAHRHGPIAAGADITLTRQRS